MQIAAFDHFPVSHLTVREVLISSLSIGRAHNPGCSNFSRDLLSCLIDPCGDQVVIYGILIQHLVKRLELRDDSSYHGCLD